MQINIEGWGENMDETCFLISFPDSSPALANQYASNLTGFIREIRGISRADQQRVQDNTQDLGSTIVLILGTASVTIVAQGIASWLARHSGAKIQIEVDGRVSGSNLDSRDVSRIVEALTQHK
ncbi:MAG: hypothetical protein ABR905_21660 [Terracidiphilus sp.]